MNPLNRRRSLWFASWRSLHSWGDISTQATAGFFKEDKAGGEGEKAQGASTAAGAGDGGLMGRLTAGLKHVAAAYKEEWRLMKMTETEIEQEKAAARAAAAAAAEKAAAKEAAARGEDWKPSEETALMMQVRRRTATLSLTQRT